MSQSTEKNIGAYVKLAVAGIVTNITAASTGDNTQVNGSAIDRIALGRPLSASLGIAVQATLANTFTLSLVNVVVQHTDNVSNAWANYAAFTNVVALTGITAGTAQQTVAKFDVDLTGAKQFVRGQFTPLCSRTGTDVANTFPVMVLAGMSELPA